MLKMHRLLYRSGTFLSAPAFVLHNSPALRSMLAMPVSDAIIAADAANYQGFAHG